MQYIVILLDVKERR